MTASVPPPGFIPPPGADEPTAQRHPSSAGRRRFARPSRRSLIAASLTLAVALGAIFVLFGSSSSPAVDPIAQAATVSSRAAGFRMKLSVSLTSSAFGGAVTGFGNAVVDPRDHAASMSFAIDFSSLPQVGQVVGGTTLSMDMVVDGQVAYLKLPQALLGAIPGLGDKPWLKLDVSKAAGVPGLSSLGSDPATSDPGQMLQYLRAASDGVTNQGRQRVDGVQTTHYHAKLSLDRLAAGMPSTDRSAVQQALSKLQQAAGSADVPVDVWIDAHQLIRRIGMSISLHGANGPTLQENVVADLSDYGPQPAPTPPPADQVQDASSLLSGLHVSG